MVALGKISGMGDLEAYRWNNLVEVYVFTDDGGIIASQLKRYSLQRLATAFHDLFPNCDRASEADFVNVRVGGTHWSQVVSSAEALDHPWRKELHGQFYKLQAAVRSIW